MKSLGYLIFNAMTLQIRISFLNKTHAPYFSYT